METYLTLHPIAFPTPLNSKIKTKEFLSACSNFVKFLDLFGKTFTPAIYDMSGNITKITKTYEENCDKNLYLEDMLLAERGEGKQIATDALMWLRRYLQFFLEYFEGICNDEMLQECTSVIAKVAYSNTLKPYHGWFVTLLFNIMILLFPKRNQLINQLGFSNEHVQEFVLHDMNEFTLNLRCCVNYLLHIYLVNGIEVVFQKRKFKQT
ncbi:hypothetical protein RI129_005871 [Pyrocoelia pectoralis]|uniref:Glycolipid transfer protein domain-containing protein n=1 Tax=Pyrocoelia pectoralis TaxID=417401 RepID=A0AAN7ZNY0_9COLE